MHYNVARITVVRHMLVPIGGVLLEVLVLEEKQGSPVLFRSLLIVLCILSGDMTTDQPTPTHIAQV
jgi:hypothetical protein